MLSRPLVGLILRTLYDVQADRWLLPGVPESAGFVVTLHHVAPGGEAASFAPNAHLSVTPAFLESFIAFFKAQGWRFVSVEDILNPGGSSDSSGRRIALTLDDGYRDNLRHAWPIFRRHRVPFTIYVCAGFCDRTAELWWEALHRIIRDAEEFPACGSAASGRFPARTPGEKQRVFDLWSEWLTGEASELEQRRAIRALAERFNFDLRALAEELCMDWEEVRTIAADPLCTIGAHTMTHAALARLTATEALREMSASADRIEAEIGVRPRTIAFPYGYRAAADEREAELAADAGFRASFTTRPGFIPLSGRRQGLPRISLNGRYQDARLFRPLLAPGFWKLQGQIWRAAYRTGLSGLWIQLIKAAAGKTQANPATTKNAS